MSFFWQAFFGAVVGYQVADFVKSNYKRLTEQRRRDANWRKLVARQRRTESLQKARDTARKYHEGSYE